MGVAQVMDADSLEPCHLGTSRHLMVQQVLCHGREYPRAGLGFHMEPQVLLNLSG